jgi:hypothetical protein
VASLGGNTLGSGTTVVGCDASPVGALTVGTLHNLIGPAGTQSELSIRWRRRFSAPWALREGR